MRITNKIIQNNSLTNINTNKVLQDKLSNMIATEKKINRPSDDPIIALRSLRLRTSVNQTDQYRTKNVEDAKSWLTVTEDAIGTLSDIITDVRKQYVKGASDPLAPSDRRIIHENLESLAKEIYNTGNADFAGRSVFTGYRTDTSLTFSKDEDVKFDITETLDSVTVDGFHYVHQDASDETKVSDNEIVRVRLSYSNLDSIANTSTITLKDSTTPATITVNTISSTKNPYDYVLSHPTEAVFVPETGELLLGDKAGFEPASGSMVEIPGEEPEKPGTEPTDTADPNYATDHAAWQAKKDAHDTWQTKKDAYDAWADKDAYEAYSLKKEDVTACEINYAKSKWDKGDLRPQHYFRCVETVVDPPDTIEYNVKLVEDPANPGTKMKVFNSPDGEICYNIGVNQSLRINTTAGECFNHSIVREIEDVIRAIDDVEDIEEKIKNLEAEYEKLAETDTEGRQAKQDEIDAAKKAQTFLNEKLHSVFSQGISFADAHLAANSLALTNCGTRSKRLELIENRLDTQLSTLKELKSENEDADMAETAVRLSSAKYAYDASLMATSKAIQQTLLNYL